MLARFDVLLPVPFYAPRTLVDANLGLELEIAGMRITFKFPHRSTVQSGETDLNATTPLMEVVRSFSRADPQPVDPSVTLDGIEAVRCDAARIEFSRESFDRRPGADDPPIALAFSLVNDWLARARVVSQAWQVTSVAKNASIWRIDLLNDDGSGLPDEPPLIRRRMNGVWRASVVALNEDLWSKIASLPWGFAASSSESLLLDAQAALQQDVGVAVVLTFTALEVRISQALDILAPMMGTQPAMWRWVNERPVPKSPSVEEQFDTLLMSVARRSLKEESGLWEGFKNLRTARNRFAHSGVPSIGTEEVDVPRAAGLIATARRILDWVDALLPEADRRPVSAAGPEVAIVRVLHAEEPHTGDNSINS